MGAGQSTVEEAQTLKLLGHPARWPLASGLSQATTLAAAGGLVSLIGYAIVIYAMSIAPMGGVAAMPEPSSFSRR
jgi:hypothetical protein